MIERIFFIRHPQTLWEDVKDPEDQNFKKRLMGSTDISLSKKGIENAKIISNYIAGVNPDKIWSSPLRRAKSTAILISRTIKKPILISHDLKEIDFGICEGMVFEEIRERFPETYSSYVGRALDINFPEGETLNQFRSRVYKFIEGIVASECGTIVVVTHGGVIRAALCKLLNVPDHFIWNVHLEYGSVTSLFAIGDSFVIEKVNYVPWQK